MSNKNSDLEYVSNALRKAEANGGGYPMIWCLWGVIVFVGYAVVEFFNQYASMFWTLASIGGGLLSWWLAERGDRTTGQSDKVIGVKYMWHFSIATVFIFTAMFTRQYIEILLLIGLCYSLAGLYLDRFLHGVGALALFVYLGIHFKLISSPMFVGAVLALGFFASAWVTSRGSARQAV